MKRKARAAASAWPYATVLSCLHIYFAFSDGSEKDWGWLVIDATFAAVWFLVAQLSWEGWSRS